MGEEEDSPHRSKAVMKSLESSGELEASHTRGAVQKRLQAGVSHSYLPDDFNMRVSLVT